MKVSTILAGQTASAAIGLGASVILLFALARFLGPEEFGVFGLVLSVQHFLLIVQEGGFRTLLLRETIRSTAAINMEADRLVGLATGHVLLVTVPAIIGILVLLAGHSLRAALVLAVLGGTAKALTSLVSGALIGRGRFLKEAWWQAASRIGVTIIAITTAAVTHQTLLVLLSLFLAQLVFLVPVFHGVHPARPGLENARSVYAFSARMMLLAFMTNLYFRTGPLFIYFLKGDMVAISHFSLAHRLLDAALFLIAPAAQILFFSSRKANALPVLDNRLRLLAGGWTLLLLSAAVAGFIFGAPLIAFLAGESFREAGHLVGWFMLSLMLAGPNYLMMQLLLARNAESAVVISGAFAVAASLALNGILIPVSGASGAAQALLGAELVLCGRLLLALRRQEIRKTG